MESESQSKILMSLQPISKPDNVQWRNGYNQIDESRANAQGTTDSENLPFDTLKPNRLKNREQFDIAKAEDLKKILPEMLKNRPDIMQAILSDLQQNSQEIESMLAKLYSLKQTDGQEHPLKSCLRVLTAFDAVDGFQIKTKELKDRQSTEISPFNNELLNLPEVWQSISLDSKKFIDENGQKKSGNFMTLEFKMSDVYKIKLPDDASPSEKQLAQNIQKYMQLRYNWESNAFQDKTIKIVKYLGDDHSVDVNRLKLLLSASSEQGNAKNKTITREQCQTVVDRKRLGFSYDTMADINRILKIDSMLTRDTTIINADHGWCGDSRVNDTFIAQSLYRLSTQMPSEQIIAINSDNMGIKQTVVDRLRSLKTLLKIRRKNNNNIAEGEYLGLRHDGKDSAVFTQKEYGRDIFWKLNTVLGVLGQKDGKSNKVLTTGWSFGGGATIETETIIADYADRKFKEQIKDKIDSAYNLKKNLHEKIENVNKNNGHGGSPDMTLWQNIVKNSADHIKRLQQSLETGITQQDVINKSAYMPDITSIRFAPAVENSCIFLGQSDSIKNLGKKALGIASTNTVSLGNFLSRKGLTLIDAGERTLKKIASLYTGLILPVPNENSNNLKFSLSEDKEAVRRMADIHALNYSSGSNDLAVNLQTKGLKNYSGLTDRQVELLQKKLIPEITFSGASDRLVGLDATLNVIDKHNAQEGVVIVNSGHCVTASEEVQKFPYEILFSLGQEGRYKLLENWRNIAQMAIGIAPGKTIRDLSASEYYERLNGLPINAPIEVGKLLSEVEDLYPKQNKSLSEKAVKATVKYTAVMYCTSA